MGRRTDHGALAIQHLHAHGRLRRRWTLGVYAGNTGWSRHPPRRRHRHDPRRRRRRDRTRRRRPSRTRSDVVGGPEVPRVALETDDRGRVAVKGSMERRRSTQWAAGAPVRLLPHEQSATFRQLGEQLGSITRRCELGAQAEADAGERDDGRAARRTRSCIGCARKSADGGDEICERRRLAQEVTRQGGNHSVRRGPRDDFGVQAIDRQLGIRPRTSTMARPGSQQKVSSQRRSWPSASRIIAGQEHSPVIQHPASAAALTKGPGELRYQAARSACRVDQQSNQTGSGRCGLLGESVQV